MPEPDIHASGNSDPGSYNMLRIDPLTTDGLARNKASLGGIDETA